MSTARCLPGVRSGARSGSTTERPGSGGGGRSPAPAGLFQQVHLPDVQRALAQHGLEGEQTRASDRPLQIAQLEEVGADVVADRRLRAPPPASAGAPSRGWTVRAWTRSRQSMSATTSPGKRAFSDRRYSPRRVWSACPEAIDSNSSTSLSNPTPSQSRVARSLRSKTTTTRRGRPTSRTPAARSGDTRTVVEERVDARRPRRSRAGRPATGRARVAVAEPLGEDGEDRGRGRRGGARCRSRGRATGGRAARPGRAGTRRSRRARSRRPPRSRGSPRRPGSPPGRSLSTQEDHDRRLEQSPRSSGAT